MNKFFCDVHRTFLSMNGCDRESELLKFVSLLKKISQNRELSFSFISTESLDEIMLCVEELKKTLGDYSKIKFGRQYSESQFMDEEGNIVECSRGKHIQILDELMDNNYNTVYFADDTPANHMLLTGVIKRKELKVDIIKLAPGCKCNSHLAGLNQLLEEHLDNKDKEDMNR